MACPGDAPRRGRVLVSILVQKPRPNRALTRACIGFSPTTTASCYTSWRPITVEGVQIAATDRGQLQIDALMFAYCRPTERRLGCTQIVRWALPRPGR
jgi:hypothetical protein